MEQGCEELTWSAAEVEQPLEALQLEDGHFVQEPEVQLAEEVEEVVLLAELVEVAWEMEQDCEDPYVAEQTLEEMQLEDNCLVEGVQVQPTEELVQLAEPVVVAVE